jgi:hypothetical protein
MVYPEGYYVYAYIRKSNLTPYYIGKGKYNRAYVKYHNVSVPKDRRYVHIIAENLTELGALALERRIIEWYGRKDLGTGILYNRTDGGDTTTGYVTSEETKKKLSEIGKGKKRSKEFRDNLSEFRKTFRYSEESKKKMSEAKKGKKLTQDHIDKTRTWGMVQSDYQKQKVAEALSKKYRITDPDGNTFEIKNLRKFCRENNLDQGNMYRNNVKGWVCEKLY